MGELEHYISVLRGGLRCITVPVPTSRSVTLIVLVRVGSRYEEKEVNGISHFMEHMFFKGAEKYPDAMAVAGAIDGAGGSFNAFTGEELVGYFIKISSSKKEIAYDVLSDMLLKSKFDADEIKRERGVIVEEIRMHRDDPMSQIHQDFHSLAFGDQPLGWDIAGSEDVVLSMTRDRFIEHHKKFYYGANMVITASGDLTQSENEELCAKYFAFGDNGGEAATAKPYEKMQTRRVFVNERKTEQAHFIFGFLTNGAEQEDEPAMKLLNIVLGGQMSSRLFYQIRERRGLAYYIHSSFSVYHDVGQFKVSAGVNLDKLDEALKCAVEEVEKIKTEKVSEEELTRAKENIKGHNDLALEDTRRVASLYGVHELLYRKIKTPDQLAAEIDAVTAEQVQKAAQKYFLDDAMQLAVIGPYSKDNDWHNVFRLG
ncbi:MAG: peptidase M16 [bacterium]|nr:MAG: peptidase M16 [bacterium]